MIRILCCGSAVRGDDAAGVLAAERLRQLAIPAEICWGEASALMEAWAGAEDVILIDAVTTGSTVGTVHVWDARDTSVPNYSNASTHGFGVGQAIELARALGRLPQRLRIFGIEAAAFELGSTACVPVKQAAEKVAEQVAQLARSSPGA